MLKNWANRFVYSVRGGRPLPPRPWSHCVGWQNPPLAGFCPTCTSTDLREESGPLLSQHQQILFLLELADVHTVAIPLDFLVFDQLVEDMVAEGFTG